MKRIRSMGLAITLAMAVSAFVGISSASASGFLTESVPASLQGESTTTHSFSTPYAEMKCSQSTFTKSMDRPTEKLAVAPSYAGCVQKDGKASMSVNMNGCQFQFRAGNETSKDQYNGTVDIGPAGCGPIVISGQACTQKIPAQTGFSGLSYENVGSGASQYFKVSTALTGIKFTSEGANCGTYSGSSGIYTGTWKVDSPVGVQVAGSGSLYISGTPPQLRTYSYPSGIVGSQTVAGPMKYTLAPGSPSSPGTLECGEASFGGQYASAQSEFEVLPTFGNCKIITIFGNITATTDTHGCGYRYSITGSSPYTGSLSLTCPEGGELEAKGTGCTVKIPAQVLGTVTYKDPVGDLATVSAAATGEGLSYSAKGALCSGGSGSGAKFSTTSLLGSIS